MGQTVASHVFADAPYRLSFGAAFQKALRFGAPLTANGLGLAVAAQGDRLLVGALLGPEALGLYVVAMLAVLVPVTLVQRMMGALCGAALYNSGGDRTETLRRIARAAPAVGAFYACGGLAFANTLVALAFGPRFVLPSLGLALLCAAALLRIARAEPFTSLLLLDRRTKEAALGNLSAWAGLLVSAGLMLAHPGVESALFGRALGEAIALSVTFSLTRPMLGAAAADFAKALAFACLLTLIASLPVPGAPTALVCAALAAAALTRILIRGEAPARVGAAP
ncbi:O-antigen/teichoic acid export membrane protein [Rhodoblastus acidophilus]|uniref:lipopolysaccharide biosynthesis protein n=1 Tax=Rhodoblastus acidophilus TaxID=1074 RepID=UPI002224F3C7|nr:oligosaccharide flippase family protein [Rhodoblastus acidophilus]MCW2285588.1 O-antigen/teichoic acid export membrane protein [Rhodoblastus acidophilus]MCW2334496.1 O-antigen/teichoic acid export membrane protein [Rhodoblastus acidophilus]